MKLLEQDKEYNCGVYAVHFLLQCNGIEKDLSSLEKELNTTEENGTSHNDIISFFKPYLVKYGYNTYLKNLKENCPTIVNYQYEEDGHYGVVLSVTDKNIVLYNPGIGEIDIIDKLEFDKVWYSKRYGAKWFLSII